MFNVVLGGFTALDLLFGGGGGVGFLNSGVWQPVFFFLRLNIIILLRFLNYLLNRVWRCEKAITD
jgi:hypothetical protein